MRHLQRMESAHSFVAHLLRLALQLSAAMAATNQDKEDERTLPEADGHPNGISSMSVEHQQMWIHFMDGVSLLQAIDISDMQKPNISVIAQTFVPHTEYDFFVRKLDYRLIFAINSGSESQIQKTPVFTPQDLDTQLNSVVSLDKWFKIVEAENRLTK
eukprot:gene19993-20518_t